MPTTSITDREDNGLGASCLKGGQGNPPGHRVPSLGITADTFTGTESRSEDPDPLEQSAGSRAFSKSGVDTGSIAIRGGTHFEFSYLPSTTFRATLRGIDLSAWYTTAWMDKYVKGDKTADARLLSHPLAQRHRRPRGRPRGRRQPLLVLLPLPPRPPPQRRLALRLRGPPHRLRRAW